MTFMATVNNVPVPTAIIHNVTYVEVAPSEKLLGINYALDGGTMWGTPFEEVHGTMIGGNLYAPWYQLAQNIRAKHIPNGWEFDTVDNVLTAAPFILNNYGIYFWSDVGLPTETTWQLDTGAFEPLIGSQTATLMNLPNLGPADGVGGVGGLVSNAYFTAIPQLTIGGHVFTNVQAIVDPTWTLPNLFGYRFFEDNGYSLYVDKRNFTFNIIK